MQYTEEVTVCAAAGCERQFYQRARGGRRLYCSPQCQDRVTQRARREAGYVPVHKRDDTPRCEVEGCELARYSLGYCTMHYTRLQKSGNPGEVGARRARNGEGQWHPNGQGYIVRCRNGTNELQHRVVMAEELGRELYSDENAHHRNGDRRDNRPENLELWSTWQPAGQRVEEKVAWARELLARYEPEGY
jgi:hypothetical protein